MDVNQSWINALWAGGAQIKYRTSFFLFLCSCPAKPTRLLSDVLSGISELQSQAQTCRLSFGALQGSVLRSIMGTHTW